MPLRYSTWYIELPFAECEVFSFSVEVFATTYESGVEDYHYSLMYFVRDSTVPKNDRDAGETSFLFFFKQQKRSRNHFEIKTCFTEDAHALGY